MCQVKKVDFLLYLLTMSFAENVRFELNFQDMQVKELSDRTGISKNTLDKYLFGKTVQPGVENAVKIAQALGVSVEYLTLGKPAIKPDDWESLSQECKIVVEQYSRLNKFNRKTIDDILLSLVSRQA